MTLKEQYKKEEKRIKRFTKSAEKRGFTFDEKDTKFKTENIRRKDVEKLKNTKPADLYKKAKYTTPEGKTMSGTEGRSYERSQASKKGWEHRSATYLVLANVEEMIAKWSPREEWKTWAVNMKTTHKNTLDNILKGAISARGRKEVARSLEEQASTVNGLVDDILYKIYADYGSKISIQDEINNDLVLFTAIVYSQAPTVSEAQNISDEREEAINDFLNSIGGEDAEWEDDEDQMEIEW